MPACECGRALIWHENRFVCIGCGASPWRCTCDNKVNEGSEGNESRSGLDGHTDPRGDQLPGAGAVDDRYGHLVFREGQDLTDLERRKCVPGGDEAGRDVDAGLSGDDQ